MALHCSSDKRRLDCQVVPNPIWPVCLKKGNFGFAEMAFVGKITFCSSMRTGFSELVQKPDAPTWKWKWVTRDSQKDTSQANTVWKRPCAKHSWKQGPMPEGVLSCPRECHVTQVPVDSHTQVHVRKYWPHIHRRGKAEKKEGKFGNCDSNRERGSQPQIIYQPRERPVTHLPLQPLDSASCSHIGFELLASGITTVS